MSPADASRVTEVIFSVASFVELPVAEGSSAEVAFPDSSLADGSFASGSLVIDPEFCVDSFTGLARCCVDSFTGLAKNQFNDNIINLLCKHEISS
jgi:hypothetical protein